MPLDPLDPWHASEGEAQDTLPGVSFYDTLIAEDDALGDTQLLEVERAFRTLKTTLEFRPVYRRKDDRI